jgi:ribosomal protein S18 acetylase RimI-like enzyme
MATPDTDPREKLKRERPGTYRTGDGRFTVEQTSSGWLLLDAEQTDDLGLPLARGPFGTLDEARDAVGTARTGPAPASDLAQRAAAGPKAAARTTSADKAASGKAARASAATKSAEPAGEPTGRRAPRRAPPPRPIRPPIVIREIRTVDGNALRALWQEAGLEAPGDDDKSLARLARRNPGLVLVAAEGSRVVGSALGAWDGRRGWIYHLATAPSHRRRGIATRLIDQIETALASLGCPKANVMVRPGNDGGAEFWTARGYKISESRQYGRELDRSS